MNRTIGAFFMLTFALVSFANFMNWLLIRDLQSRVMKLEKEITFVSIIGQSGK